MLVSVVLVVMLMLLVALKTPKQGLLCAVQETWLQGCRHHAGHCVQ
jgi:hypothetical protein